MYLGIDIGGTKSRVGISKTGTNLDKYSIFPTPKVFDEGIRRITEEAKEILASETPTAVVCGVKGPLDDHKAILLNPPDLPDWSKKNIKEILSKEFNAQVTLENDAALAGIGEALFGPGKGKEIVVYITLSTGVGGVRIVNGKIDKNTLGFEPGHQIIDPKSDIVCGCGGYGHLEAFVGGASIERQKNLKPDDIDDEFFWDDIAKKLSTGLNNVIVLWSPEIIILGGPLMEKIPLEKVKLYTKDALTIFPEIPDMKRGELGELNGLYGALSFFKN